MLNIATAAVISAAPFQLFAVAMFNPVTRTELLSDSLNKS